MKGFITLTNVYQDAPTIVNVCNINYFYRQDSGVKHTVIICKGSEHGLSVQEDYEEVARLIQESMKDDANVPPAAVRS